MAHILIIDDEAWLANKLAVHLEKDGHRVATFTGHMVPAFRMIEKLRPDLVVLENFRLHEYNGMELVYIIRNTPALAQLPIILLESMSPLFPHAPLSQVVPIPAGCLPDKALLVGGMLRDYYPAPCQPGSDKYTV